MRFLEKRGHTVVLAESGRQALAAWQEQSFDLILMDVQMPEMDGLEATALIREQERMGNPERLAGKTYSHRSHDRSRHGRRSRTLSGGGHG